MLRAIVFDFDGVIANSEPPPCTTGVSETSWPTRRGSVRDDYYARYLGYDVWACSETLAVETRRRDDRRVAALVANKATRMEALERNVSVLFPGADAPSVAPPPPRDRHRIRRA